MMTSSNANIFRVTGPSSVWGIHRPPVNSPHKGQWCGALMFSLICARINGWVNNGEAGDLTRHRAHYDVIVMCLRLQVVMQLAVGETACVLGSLVYSITDWNWKDGWSSNQWNHFSIDTSNRGLIQITGFAMGRCRRGKRNPPIQRNWAPSQYKDSLSMYSYSHYKDKTRDRLIFIIESLYKDGLSMYNDSIKPSYLYTWGLCW